MAPGKTLQIYNPLHLFDPALDLDTLEIEVRFGGGDGQREYSATVVVHPVKYENKATFTLPREGRIYVWDGHDLYAHHRRFDFLHPDLQKLGFTTNFQRYGYDLVFVNERGEMNDGDPKRNETWFGFGRPVQATAPGTVAAVHDGQPDNRTFDPKEIAKRELAFGGNYVIVDHGNGEFSHYGHLKQDSVRVKIGDRVERGQVLGAVGASGSSLFPHLHYELRDDLGDRKADGLPSYFHDFRRVLGSRSVTVTRGSLDTGDIVENP